MVRASERPAFLLSVSHRNLPLSAVQI